MVNFELVSEALNFISSDERDLWLRIGMAIKSELGESGFDIWDSWSQSSSSYNARDARNVWKSIQPDGGVSLGTLLHEAKKNGWRNDLDYISEREVISYDRKSIIFQVEKDEERIKTSLLAREIWQQASKTCPDHPYLLKKKISPVVTMREISLDKVKAILGYVPRINNIALAGRLLVIPIKVEDKLSSLELIDEDGKKTALYGKGTKANGVLSTIHCHS